MFADKLTRMMNFDEFAEAVKFITDMEFDEGAISGCYYLFAWPSSKKITFSKFCDIIEMGKRMNMLYMKVKRRYSGSMERYRTLYSEELQKLTISDTDNYIPLVDVVRLFNINKIELSEVDCEFLKEEGAIVLKDNQSYVDINLFMRKVFPEISIFDNFIREKSVRKLQKYYKKYKSKEVQRKN